MGLFGDRYLLVCWAVAGGSAVLSVTLAPWLMRRSLRKRGRPAASALRQVAACFLMGAVAPIGIMLFGGLWQTGFMLLGLIAACLLLFSVARRPRLPVVGWHLGVILLCNLGYFQAFLMGLARGREIAKRAVDRSNLKGIHVGLLMYAEEHGVFPDDLRQLVDAGFLSPKCLLPVYAYTRAAFPDTRPYSGPCEFVYVRLPRDAPEGLVWVWESPKYHAGEGAYVLYASGDVRWVTPEKLREDLERTEAWLHAAQRGALSTPTSTTSVAN